MRARSWAKPWMVSSKTKSYKAYPFRTSEYVVDIDSYLAYQPHSHRTRNNEPCVGCLQNAYDLTLKVLEVIEEKYSDIRLVFSGRQGFHIHVFDFQIEDWTRIEERNMLKSHEVARFIYTGQLAEKVPEAFDKSHLHARGAMILSSHHPNCNARANSDDFVCKVAKSSEEAVELIELGFEFVNEINGSYLYRKRK